MLGAGGRVDLFTPTPSSIQDELTRRKAVIHQQIINESLKSTRLKELEYAQRLALSTTTNPTAAAANDSISRFVASRLSGNQNLVSMLGKEEEESKKPSATVESTKDQTSQTKSTK